MPAEYVHPEILVIALDRVDGTRFESFVNAFYPALYGREFVPLGGVHDGGADALLAAAREATGQLGHFLQSSVTEEYRQKIRDTVRRLREVGRSPATITYVTSRRIPMLDQVEQELNEELGVTVRLRDREYVKAHINDSPQTRAAFDTYLHPVTDFLRHVGASSAIAPSEHAASPAVYVFLRQEVERRGGDLSLVEAVIDSLILWALEGTDPNQDKFMRRSEIAAKIEETIPSTREFIPSLLNKRLESLSDKTYPLGRQVRWHRKEDLFCLPYETRKRIADENVADETLRITVLDQFAASLFDQVGSSLGEAAPALGAQVALRTVQLSFERRGLEFCQFLASRNETEGTRTVAESLGIALDGFSVAQKVRGPLADAVFETLRLAFYASTEQQRIYFGKLARTYAILFTLKAEPRLIEYFQEMTADFYLYVGTDVLVRALSERYLRLADQMTRNMLRMAAEAGATLVLSEPVLDEVVHHLMSTDQEFQDYFASAEADMTLEVARQSPKILIRAYFYARFNENLAEPPPSWPAFINQFCDHRELRRPKAYGAIKAYLEAQFSLRFESKAELAKLVRTDVVEELATRLAPEKAAASLAANDALMAHAVYGRRHALGETSRVSEFGFRTWWLTAETTILKHTQSLVDENMGARYMMRPEFMLNFLALSPTVAEVRESYREIFPTMLGIRLAKRMDEAAFHKIMEGVHEAEQLEEGRRKAKIAEYADKLKTDFRRQYLAVSLANQAPT